MRDELEPEDDELNPPHHDTAPSTNGKLGIARDKLEPRDELGTTGNKLGTKLKSLKQKPDSKPPLTKSEHQMSSEHQTSLGFSATKLEPPLTSL